MWRFPEELLSIRLLAALQQWQEFKGGRLRPSRAGDLTLFCAAAQLNRRKRRPRARKRPGVTFRDGCVAPRSSCSGVIDVRRRGDGCRRRLFVGTQWKRHGAGDKHNNANANARSLLIVLSGKTGEFPLFFRPWDASALLFFPFKLTSPGWSWLFSTVAMATNCPDW